MGLIQCVDFKPYFKEFRKIEELIKDASSTVLTLSVWKEPHLP